MRALPLALALAALLPLTLRAQTTLPPAPASGERSGPGGNVDRFADAVFEAGIEAEAEAIGRIRTLTVDLDEGVVFWRVTRAERVGDLPTVECRVVAPDLPYEPAAFCTSLLTLGEGESGPADGPPTPYAVTYHARRWGGRNVHAFTTTGPDGGPLDAETERLEMWIDADTYALVLFRTTGREFDGEPAFTFSFERGDLRLIKGVVVPHYYRYSLYGAAPMFIQGFTPEEEDEMALVAEALDASDLEAAIDALPQEVQDAFGFYAAVLGNQPLEVDYEVRDVRFNQPLPAGVFGGFGR